MHVNFGIFCELSGFWPVFVLEIGNPNLATLTAVSNVPAEVLWINTRTPERAGTFIPVLWMSFSWRGRVAGWTSAEYRHFLTDWRWGLDADCLYFFFWPFEGDTRQRPIRWQPVMMCLLLLHDRLMMLRFHNLSDAAAPRHGTEYLQVWPQMI